MQDLIYIIILHYDYVSEHERKRKRERIRTKKRLIVLNNSRFEEATLTHLADHITMVKRRNLAVYSHISKEKISINNNRRKQSPNRCSCCPPLPNPLTFPLSLALLHIVHIKHSLWGTREQIYLFLDVRHIQGGNHFFLVGRSCWFCFDAAPSRLPAPSWHPRTQTADHTEGDVRRQAW